MLSNRVVRWTLRLDGYVSRSLFQNLMLIPTKRSHAHILTKHVIPSILPFSTSSNITVSESNMKTSSSASILRYDKPEDDASPLIIDGVLFALEIEQAKVTHEFSVVKHKPISIKKVDILKDFCVALCYSKVKLTNQAVCDSIATLLEKNSKEINIDIVQTLFRTIPHLPVNDKLYSALYKTTTSFVENRESIGSNLIYSTLLANRQLSGKTIHQRKLYEFSSTLVPYLKANQDRNPLFWLLCTSIEYVEGKSLEEKKLIRAITKRLLQFNLRNDDMNANANANANSSTTSLKKPVSKYSKPLKTPTSTILRSMFQGLKKIDRNILEYHDLIEAYIHVIRQLEPYCVELDTEAILKLVKLLYYFSKKSTGQMEPIRLITQIIDKNIYGNLISLSGVDIANMVETIRDLDSKEKYFQDYLTLLSKLIKMNVKSIISSSNLGAIIHGIVNISGKGLGEGKILSALASLLCNNKDVELYACDSYKILLLSFNLQLLNPGALAFMKSLGRIISFKVENVAESKTESKTMKSSEVEKAKTEQLERTITEKQNTSTISNSTSASVSNDYLTENNKNSLEFPSENILVKVMNSLRNTDVSRKEIQPALLLLAKSLKEYKGHDVRQYIGSIFIGLHNFTGKTTAQLLVLDTIADLIENNPVVKTQNITTNPSDGVVTTEYTSSNTKFNTTTVVSIFLGIKNLSGKTEEEKRLLLLISSWLKDANFNQKIVLSQEGLAKIGYSIRNLNGKSKGVNAIYEILTTIFTNSYKSYISPQNMSSILCGIQSVSTNSIYSRKLIEAITLLLTNMPQDVIFSSLSISRSCFGLQNLSGYTLCERTLFKMIAKKLREMNNPTVAVSDIGRMLYGLQNMKGYTDEEVELIDAIATILQNTIKSLSSSTNNTLSNHDKVSTTDDAVTKPETKAVDEPNSNTSSDSSHVRNVVLTSDTILNSLNGVRKLNPRKSSVVKLLTALKDLINIADCIYLTKENIDIIKKGFNMKFREFQDIVQALQTSPKRIAKTAVMTKLDQKYTHLHTDRNDDPHTGKRNGQEKDSLKDDSNRTSNHGVVQIDKDDKDGFVDVDIDIISDNNNNDDFIDDIDNAGAEGEEDNDRATVSEDEIQTPIEEDAEFMKQLKNMGKPNV